MSREEVGVHAVVATVSIQSGREDESIEFLKADVLPRVKQAPGVIAGYWLAPEAGKGFAFTVFETEEAAQAGLEMAQKSPRPDYVTFDSIEVREVIARV
jgi:heme-degrading monooxygenase HmoA